MHKSLQPLHVDPPVTRESILAAKLAQLTERAKVTAETGYVFPPDPDFLIDPLVQWTLGISAAAAALKR